MQAHLPDVVGWREAVPEHTVARDLAEMLVELGVREAFGLIGGGIAPFGVAFLVLLFSIGRSSNATAAVMRWGDVAIAPFVEV